MDFNVFNSLKDIIFRVDEIISSLEYTIHELFIQAKLDEYRGESLDDSFSTYYENVNEQWKMFKEELIMKA